MTSRQLIVGNATALHGLPDHEKADRFTIDLMGTRLSFCNPKCNLKDGDFLWGFQVDRRPFVNTVTKAAYHHHPVNQRASCDLYQTGWAMFTRRWWKKLPQGILKLSVSLESPAGHEYEHFPNLFDERCLKDWLALYYRDRQAILGRTSFELMPDGALEISFADENAERVMDVTAVPLQRLPEPVSGLPGYFLFLNPGIVEFNVPIGRRDLLQIRFQLKCLASDPGMIEQLKNTTLDFAHRLIKSVTIELSPTEAAIQFRRVQHKLDAHLDRQSL